MANIDALLERNKQFATTAVRKGISMTAKYPVCVITCLDPRTEPAAFLELDLGDAIVIRDAGGPSVPGVLTGLVTTILPAAPMHSTVADPANSSSQSR